MMLEKRINDFETFIKTTKNLISGLAEAVKAHPGTYNIPKEEIRIMYLNRCLWSDKLIDQTMRALNELYGDTSRGYNETVHAFEELYGDTEKAIRKAYGNLLKPPITLTYEIRGQEGRMELSISSWTKTKKYFGVRGESHLQPKIDEVLKKVLEK